jgi:hypothetical protein
MLSNQLGLNVADLANGKATPSWETIEGLRHSASRDADQRRCQMERTDVGRRLDLRNISIDFAPPVPAYAVTISTAAGSAGYRTGTAVLASCRIAHASPLSARLVSCAASQPLPQFRR